MKLIYLFLNEINNITDKDNPLPFEMPFMTTNVFF